MEPAKAVGHSGQDGQVWEGVQSKVVKRFHEGACRLLVSTSGIYICMYV